VGFHCLPPFLLCRKFLRSPSKTYGTVQKIGKIDDRWQYSREPLKVPLLAKLQKKEDLAKEALAANIG